MATDIKTEITEAELLHSYLGLRLEKGKRKGSLDDVSPKGQGACFDSRGDGIERPGGVQGNDGRRY